MCEIAIGERSQCQSQGQIWEDGQRFGTASGIFGDCQTSYLGEYSLLNNLVNLDTLHSYNNLFIVV